MGSAALPSRNTITVRYALAPVATQPSLITPKARATRKRLLVTARELFEAEGFEQASINRIVDAANVSRGTFYLYFSSRSEIFKSLIQTIQNDLVAMQRWSLSDIVTPEDGLRQVIRSYFQFYRENARMMAVLEQVAVYDDEFREMRLGMRRAVGGRAVQFIERLQQQGTVPATVDARYAATALTGMVDRFAFVWLILEEDFEEEQAIETLATLWYQAIGGVMTDGGC